MKKILSKLIQSSKRVPGLFPGCVVVYALLVIGTALLVLIYGSVTVCS